MILSRYVTCREAQRNTEEDETGGRVDRIVLPTSGTNTAHLLTYVNQPKCGESHHLAFVFPLLELTGRQVGGDVDMYGVQGYSGDGQPRNRAPPMGITESHDRIRSG